MNIRIFFTAIACSLLFPLAGSCELEGRTYYDNSAQGLRAYKRPKLTPPPGWIEHDAAGQDMHGIVLIHPGLNDQDEKATIYATAVPKEQPTQKLYSFIVSDMNVFRKNSDHGKVVKAESLRTAKGEMYTYTYSYTDEGKQYIQTVAFTAEDNYFLSFVLTGKSKQAHDNAYKTFKDLLAAYK